TKLGTTYVANAAVVAGAVMAAPLVAVGSFGAAVGVGFTTLAGVSTLNQTSNAAVAQYQDPGSPDAWFKTGQAALSWASMGTADVLASPLSTAQAVINAKNLNMAVTGVNLLVDVPAAYNTCSQSGVYTLECGAASAGVVADVGFGLLDYKQGKLPTSATVADSGAAAAVESVASSVATPISTSAKTLYEFESFDAYQNYQDYIRAYGRPPADMNVIQHPNQLYSFQEEAINLATKPGINNKDIASYMQQFAENPDLTIKVLTPDEMAIKFPGDKITGGACVNDICKTGFLGLKTKKTSTVYVMTPSGYATLYPNATTAETKQIMLQKLGHEIGHGYDWMELGLSDVWATEIRQKVFNAKFYQSTGQNDIANSYLQWVGQVQNASTLYVK
ncbi:MAG: hypothetical protein WCL07_00980, partial [bacterium]